MDQQQEQSVAGLPLLTAAPTSQQIVFAPSRRPLFQHSLLFYNLFQFLELWMKRCAVLHDIQHFRRPVVFSAADDKAIKDYTEGGHVALNTYLRRGCHSSRQYGEHGDSFTGVEDLFCDDEDYCDTKEDDDDCMGLGGESSWQASEHGGWSAWGDEDSSEHGGWSAWGDEDAMEHGKDPKKAPDESPETTLDETPKTTARDENLKTRCEAILTAMGKLKTFVGTVYRGTGLPEAIGQAIREGSVYSDLGFMSSSTEKTDSFPGHYWFIIKSKCGVDVSEHSAYKAEAEVLFRPGTMFNITKVKYLGWRTVVSMEEIEMVGSDEDV